MLNIVILRMILFTFMEESSSVRSYCIIFVKFKARQPMYVTQYLSSKTESTLHMLGANEIHEVIHRTSNAEKLETDLITALSHVTGLSRGGGKCYNDHGSRLETLAVYSAHQKNCKNLIASCELNEYNYTHFCF